MEENSVEARLEVLKSLVMVLVEERVLAHRLKGQGIYVRQDHEDWARAFRALKAVYELEREQR